jgi:hypothetical protein
MELPIDEVLKEMRATIGLQAQEIAVLKATLTALQNPLAPTYTTAVTDKPDVIGTQGIKP